MSGLTDKQETMDVRHVVYGKWLKDEEESRKHIEPIYICSVCKNMRAWGDAEKNMFTYCPKCGAKLKGDMNNHIADIDKMDDLISRRQAINEMARWIGYLDDDMILRIQTSLKRLPSAEPEPQWILCSEGLPAAQTEVIVSCTDDSGDTKFRYTSSGWVTTNKEYWIVDNVINNFVVAWREMPEPYRERGDK